MRELLPESQDLILDDLIRSPRPRRLQDIAHAVDLAPPTVLRHLRQMEVLELVEKTRDPHTKTSVYAPRSSSFGHYIGRTPDDDTPGLRFSWHATGEIDWRFPLVARVPDPLGRAVLSNFLHEAIYRSLLTPKTMLASKARELHGPILPDGPSLTFVVYGSTARGEASPRSDIDLLCLVDPADGDAADFDLEAIERLASDLAFAPDFPKAGREPRVLDLRTMEWERLLSSSEGFLAPIVDDAITIHSTARRPRWIESMRTLEGNEDGPHGRA